VARGTLQSETMASRVDVRRFVRSRRARAIACVLAAPLVLGVVMGGAFAQSAKPGATSPKGHAPARPVAPKKAPATTDGGFVPPLVATPAPGPTVPGATAPVDAGVLESRTLDGGTRVYKFSELEIEGNLKSPQLVYFLRRVRAEFSAGDLGHRSFMREMSESRKEPTF
jgi:hypothetical protein